MLTPIYLTDDDGNKIEQTTGSGDYIIIGYIDSALFADTSGELRNTFLGIVQAASLEARQEVLRGLRLAKSIRGRLNRFELSGTPDNAYVKYNHSIFGGRFQSQYTALGAIAGTYLRRGGSAFTKELVEAALVTGPFANFPNTFPSLELPGDVQLSVNAGGGTVEAFAWTITNGTTTFSPTVQSPTVTLTEGTWTASVTVTIDGGDYDVGPQSFDVAVFSAASMAPSTTTPALNDTVTFSLSGMQNESLAQSSEWTFTSAPTRYMPQLDQTDTSVRNGFSTVDIPLIEDVDYEIVSQTATSVNVRFLTGGEFHVAATIRHSDNTTAVAFSSVDVVPTGSFGTLTNNSRMSTATADALYQGDTHVIVLGDSLMNPFSRNRLAEGVRTSWKPARWAGFQHGVSQIGSALSWAGYSGSNSDLAGGSNINRDGTNSSGAQITGTEVATAHYTPLGSGRGEWTLNGSTRANAIRSRIKQNGDTLYAIGRLQGTDTFDNVAGTQTSMLLVGVDTGVTLDISSPGTVEASSVTLAANQYATIGATWDPTGAIDQESLSIGWTNQTSGDKFGLLDMYTYNPNISGLSVSYMGDGGWNIGNHAGLYALNENGVTSTNVHSNPNEWYDDRAIEEHLKLYAFSDFGQTTLRDNIIILIENQNGNSYGYSNSIRLSLNGIRSRWETAANNVDPSGDLWSRIQFVFMTLPELYFGESHKEFAAQARDFIGIGGYDWCELIDLNQQLLEYDPGDGLDYSDPKTYTDIYWDDDSNNATDRVLLREADLADGDEWYSGGDMVHSQKPGSLIMMAEFWKIVENSTSSSQSVTGTVTAEPTFSQFGEAIEFDVDSITGDADRIIIWLDQNGTEVARGENPTLSNLPASVTRVDARIITADGADVTLVGPEISINELPVFTDDPQLNDYDDPIVEGDTIPIRARATDAVGSTLTYRYEINNQDFGEIGSFSPGTWAEFNIVAGAGTQTLVVFVTDGKTTEEVESAPFVFTPGSANTSPNITGSFTFTQTPTEVGDTAAFNVIGITDAEDGTTLSYVVEVSIDGGSYAEVNGALSSGTVIDGNGLGVITSSHTTDTAGDHVFRLTVTDSDGATDSITSSPITVTAPVDPFGTPDYVLTYTWDGGNGVHGDNEVEVTDNLGLNSPIDVWNHNTTGVSSGRERLRLFASGGSGTGDRATFATWMTNNPNHQIVIRWHDGRVSRFDGARKYTGAGSDAWPVSGIHDLVGIWYDSVEGLTNKDFFGAGGTTSDLNTISFYPTNALALTQQGNLPFGTNGTNANQDDTLGTLDAFMDSLQTTPGTGGIVHYSLATPFTGASARVRVFINTANGFSEFSCLQAFRDKINNGELEFRVKTGASTYYVATIAETSGNQETNTNLELHGFIDELGADIDTATVQSAVDAFADIEIWAR